MNFVCARILLSEEASLGVLPVTLQFVVVERTWVKIMDVRYW